MKTLATLPMGTGRFSPFNRVLEGQRTLDISPKREPLEDQFKDVDALVIWGGADISPSLYGEDSSEYNDSWNELSGRDRAEVTACLMAVDLGIPIIGVCRGAQLLCALAGGKLVQHVSGHGQTHSITLKDGRHLKTSSMHHQMMWPYENPDCEYDLLAWSSEKRSNIYVFNDANIQKEITRPEAEVVWFPKIKGLAIQGHPEFHHDPNDPFVLYCLDLVKKYITGETK